MKIEYPIIIKDVLPTSTFFSLRDEFKHVGWGLYNYSKNTDRENQRISWKLNQPNNTLIMYQCCLLYTSPSPRDATLSRMPSSA